MKKISSLFFFLITLIVFFVSCKNRLKETREIERAMYYWKTIVQLSDFEKSSLEKLKVETLYIKYFDVDWNRVSKGPVPVAKIRIPDADYLKTKKIIPTIFITNECILNIDSTQIEPLANKILTLVKETHQLYKLNPIFEIQIDCDWSPKTRNRYFSLLENLQQLHSSILFSATIRLHQIKFSATTGVPPVKRGLLMCYNMGNLKDPAVKNSIIEAEEFKKYTGNLKNYPLPLDIGLPLFDWNVLFRNGIYEGLIPSQETGAFKSSLFKNEKNFLTVQADSIWRGYALKKNDKIRKEESSTAEIVKIEKILKTELKDKKLRVSLFHLDSIILKKKAYETLEDIYNGLR